MRLLLLLTLLAAPALATCPLDFSAGGVVYDNFERHISVASTPDILSSCWTQGMGGVFGIAGLLPNANSYCFSGFPCTAYWSTTNGLSNDQVARGTPKGSGAQPRGGIGVRMSSNGGYFVRLTVGNAALVKYVAGVATTLASSAIATTATQYAEVSATGTTIRAIVWAAWANPLGTPVWDSGNITDASISTGSVGMLSTQYPGGTDDFMAGNYSAKNSLPLPPAAHSARIDIYTDPQASVFGTGTAANPLILDMLASHLTWVSPGDAVWLHGVKGVWPPSASRTYSPLIEIYHPDDVYMFGFAGTTGAHISVRAYPGEYVVIDPNRSCSQNYPGGSPYIVDVTPGTYIDLADFWVRNSDTSCRILTQCGSNPNPNAIRGVKLEGTGNSMINVVDYNTGEGIGSINSKGNRIIGSISVAGGWNGPDRGHGHPHYVGNTDCTVNKLISGNIFGEHGGSAGKFINSGTSPGICNQTYSENIAYRQLQRPIGIDMSGNISSGVTLDHNSFYNAPQFNAVTLGATYVATNNWFDGPTQQFLRATAGVFTGNTVSDSTSSGSLGLLGQICTACSAAQTWTSFDNNAYFLMGNSNSLSRPFSWNGTAMDFATWQGLGFDASSTMNTTSYPAKGTTPPGTTNFIRYHANPLNGTVYRGYGNIAVYNWRRLTSVSAAPTFLTSGDEYEIWDPFYFSVGPMSTGIYNGSSITIPMNQVAFDDPGFTNAWTTPYWCPAGTDTSSSNFTMTGLASGTAPYGIVVSGGLATVTTSAVHNIVGATPFPIRLTGTAGGFDGDVLVTQTGTTTYTFSSGVAQGNYQQPTTATSRKGFTSQTAFGSQAASRPQPDFGPYAVRRRNLAVQKTITIHNGVSTATSIRLLSGQSATDTSLPIVTASCTNGNDCVFSTDFHIVGKLYYQLDYRDAGGTSVKTSAALLVDMPSTFSGSTSTTFNLTGGGTAAATFATGIGVDSSGGLNPGTVGRAYSDTVTASGGTAPYTFAKPSGTLPTGITLGASTGIFSGTPTVAGLYSFTITATDATPTTSAALPLTIQINPAPAISTTLPDSLIGLPYNQTMTATGGTLPLVWTVFSGSLPTGVSMDALGNITGTSSALGTFPFTIRATDANGSVSSQAYTVHITSALSISTASPLASGPRNIFYGALLTAVNGTSPYTWAITVGALPPGLTLAPSTGLITGTPTASGVYTFTARVTDNVSAVATKDFSITIQQPQGVIGSFTGTIQ